MTPITPKDKVTDPNSPNPDQNGGNSTLNSPKVDEQGKPTERAISSAKQAHSIAKNLKDRARRGRIATAAVIASKYNGESPFNEQDLSRTGQTWRNNFSTNFLASIIDRVKPQMLDPINKADVLTHSALPGRIDNAATKSRKFCEVTTKVIRRWPSWRDFASQLAQENTLFGLAIPAWIDNPTEWRPHLWRFDEAFLPEGTGQHATKVQIAVFEQKMLLHDFLDLFRDRKAAEKACYNVDNCIKAANTTHNLGNASSTAEETDLQRQDRAREGGTMVDSYDGKAKTVDLYHVLVRDYTGGVDLWTVTQNEGWEIRCVEALHEDMNDALTLFTFQSGNGKLYGSKGLGRLLTNLHIAIERGRCLGADQMYLSGLLIFQTDKKDAAALQARVRHPFIFVGNDVKVVSEVIEFNVQAFEVMDAKLTQLAESIAGAFIPPNLNEQGANTKIEAAQNAEREMAVKEGVLGRFFDHLSDLIGAMQRKIYCDINLREGKRAYDKKIDRESNGVTVIMRKVWKLLKSAFGKEIKAEPDVSEGGPADEEAVSAVMELLEAGLTVEDIATLALSPSAQSNATDGAVKDQATLQYIVANRQNPFIDQRAATLMEGNIAIGEDRATQLIIPQDDPQVETIAMRQQLIELSEMLDGVPMPVAASDKHDTHRKVIASKMDGIMQMVMTAPTQAILQTAESVLSHYADHIKLDGMMPPDMKAAEMKAVQQDMQTVTKVNMALQKQAQQMAQQGVQAGPDGMPVPVNGQPAAMTASGLPQGPDGLPQRQSIHPDDAKLAIDIHKTHQEDQRIALEKSAQDLEASKVAHQQQMDALKMQQISAGLQLDAHQKGVEMGQSIGQQQQEIMMAKAQHAHEQRQQADQQAADATAQQSDQQAQERLAQLAAQNDPTAGGGE